MASMKNLQTLVIDKERNVYMRMGSMFTPEDSNYWFHQVNESVRWERPKKSDSNTSLNRDTAWICDCECNYQYSWVKMAPQKMPHPVWTIAEACKSILGLPEMPDCCNINRYQGLGDAVGWHQDNEYLFQALYQEATIISVSFGAARPFEIRDIKTKESRSFMIQSGDLVTMEGNFQKFYEHRVPKFKGENGARINLTFRYIKKHSRCCPGKQSLQRRLPMPTTSNMHGSGNHGMSQQPGYWDKGFGNSRPQQPSCHQNAQGWEQVLDGPPAPSPSEIKTQSTTYSGHGQGYRDYRQPRPRPPPPPQETQRTSGHGYRDYRQPRPPPPSPHQETKHTSGYGQGYSDYSQPRPPPPPSQDANYSMNHISSNGNRHRRPPPPLASNATLSFTEKSSKTTCFSERYNSMQEDLAAVQSRLKKQSMQKPPGLDVTVFTEHLLREMEEEKKVRKRRAEPNTERGCTSRAVKDDDVVELLNYQPKRKRSKSSKAPAMKPQAAEEDTVTSKNNEESESQCTSGGWHPKLNENAQFVCGSKRKREAQRKRANSSQEVRKKPRLTNEAPANSSEALGATAPSGAVQELGGIESRMRPEHHKASGYTEPHWCGKSGNYRLLVYKKQKLIGTTDLSKKRFHVIGREVTCDIKIQHMSVSRNHAVLQQGEDGMYIYDLGSTHGTFFNDRKPLVNEGKLPKRIYKRILSTDILMFGHFDKFFVFDGGPTRKEYELKVG